MLSLGPRLARRGAAGVLEAADLADPSPEDSRTLPSAAHSPSPSGAAVARRAQIKAHRLCDHSSLGLIVLKNSKRGIRALQWYLAHKKQPPPLGSP